MVLNYCLTVGSRGPRPKLNHRYYTYVVPTRAPQHYY